MITSIERLKQFGIFQDHTSAGVSDFGKYNLFYGWNGSGKSTLSSLFRSIENSQSPSRFPAASFSVKTHGGQTVTQDNVQAATLNIYTFNEDFIEENISWNNVVQSILLVDKEKISEREKLESLRNDQRADIASLKEKEKELGDLKDALSKFATSSARRLKNSLQSIDTTDAYYLNYNKTKFQQCISKNIELTQSGAPLLGDRELAELANAAKPNQKSPITLHSKTISEETFSKAKERLDDLLRTSVVSRTIQRLVDHNDIKAWVEAGLDLHRRHGQSQCEFCGNDIAAERIDEIEAHFNDEYKAFQDRLVKADQWLASQYVQQPHLPATSDLYDELKKEFEAARGSMAKAIDELNEELAAWHGVLKKKTANPLETGLSVEKISDVAVGRFNDAASDIAAAVDKHNHKSNNFKEETSKAKRRLELHFATTEVQDFSYHGKKKEAADKEVECRALFSDVEKRKIEIRNIEDALSNESLGADKFNDSLHRFLGRTELTLRFNADKKGYEIIRNDSELVEGRLSEGEKTAIAFVYFITKLKENDNKMDETIVVVDDPVSSFDSNHLFHAYSFLRSNCDRVAQLFVLTHNFTYFKLIRDWFEGINHNRARKTPPKSANARFYTVEASVGVPRNSKFSDAESSLIKYNSEYHYIFSKLYAYKEMQKLSRDDAFLTANLARKLLESFFSFKFPRYRSNMAQLMTSGLNGCEVTDAVTKEKIYRFINKYSHSAVIEVNEESSENLVGESVNVISDIFTWVQEVDSVHYEEMLEVVTQ
ncbi:hypothetical protein T35B1_18773 [Salinisphaera shabanensis T35B1]|uniref:AAA family ATPase n=1 Tax=Salinisphaera shabanensis TaxID=180542 RepID=UPI00333E4264